MISKTPKKHHMTENSKSCSKIPGRTDVLANLLRYDCLQRSKSFNTFLSFHTGLVSQNSERVVHTKIQSFSACGMWNPLFYKSNRNRKILLFRISEHFQLASRPRFCSHVTMRMNKVKPAISHHFFCTVYQYSALPVQRLFRKTSVDSTRSNTKG